MSAIVAKVLAYVLGAIALCAAVYFGIDSIVGAFRDRETLRAKVEQQERAADELRGKVAAARADADQARQDAAKAEKDARNEIALRDRLAQEAKGREAQIAKELTNAKRRLDEWKRTAADELRRCLALPVPDDDDGMLATPGQDRFRNGSGADAEDARRVPAAAGGIPG